MKLRELLGYTIRAIVTTIVVVAVDWIFRPSNAGDGSFAVDTGAIFSVAPAPVFMAVLITLFGSKQFPVNFGLRAPLLSLLATLLAGLMQFTAVTVYWPESSKNFNSQFWSIALELFVTLLIVNLAWEFRNSLAEPAGSPQDSPSGRTTP